MSLPRMVSLGMWSLEVVVSPLIAQKSLTRVCTLVYWYSFHMHVATDLCF